MIQGRKETTDSLGEGQLWAAAALAAVQADLVIPALRVRWLEMGDGEE